MLVPWGVPRRLPPLLSPEWGTNGVRLSQPLPQKNASYFASNTEQKMKILVIYVKHCKAMCNNPPRLYMYLIALIFLF